MRALGEGMGVGFDGGRSVICVAYRAIGPDRVTCGMYFSTACAFLSGRESSEP